MEPWVEGILKGVENKKLVVVDSSKGTMLLEGPEGREQEDGDGEKRDGRDRAGLGHAHEHGGVDPHIWLDLSNAQIMVDNILQGFLTKDPTNGEFYRRNAEVYKRRLRELDTRFKDTFSNCQKDIFIHGGHFAFNYLARRYNLKYLSAYKGSPDAEPTPKRMIELQESMKRHQVKYIFFEELITPRIAEVIARETGATLLRLHGAHNVTREELEGGISFLDIMEKNRENLARGLQCR
jgi:zinc transport system substrate-binding protein